MRLLLLCCLPVALTQCVDPYGNPMSPFGPGAPAPYTDGREQYRTDMREQERGQAQQAYDRGQRDGSDDARSGMPRNLQRNPFGYSSTQATAYNDGYEQAYRSSMPPSSGMPGYGPAPSYPSPGDYTPPALPPSNASQNDPSYSQGYEYGLRDRVAGRQADAGAHVGRYDPRFRRSFERGYYDAFEARR